MKRARYLVEPEIFIRHTAERNFIGPGTFRLGSGDVLMAAAWGRPPTNFEQLAARFPVPVVYRSGDGGRTWNPKGRMPIAYNHPGMFSDGGITFLRLQDGRLAFLGHRHVPGLHGGGLPAIAFSNDDGTTWTPARLLDGPEGVWYVMNDRLIQLKSGRLVLPAARAEHLRRKYTEGETCWSECFLSDDVGATWRLGRQKVELADLRGMAEPAVAEAADGRLIMLARTGSGCNFQSVSEDGGETWSKPQPTTQTAPCSSLMLKALPDGRLIVFYNHAQPLHAGAFFPRTPLVYSVSPDHGQTWGEPVLVDESGVALNDRMAIYPSICFTPQGMLVVYSVHAADPRGTFANGGPEGWKIGGGARCILEYP